ncbi:MAG: hypothetical protein LBJ64_02490 [Deltaproteobacteria bacterium]|jgi:hypothetical protein|nr:hypothetical protein [Deltaproteobacteria bacterium]
MMRRFSAFAIIGSLLLTLSGCMNFLAFPDLGDTSKNEAVGRTWLGAHVGDLIEAWGVPGGSALEGGSTEPGRRHYYWVKSHSESTGGHCDYDLRGAVTKCAPYQSWEYRCTERFLAGPDGVLENFVAYGDCGYFGTRPSRDEGGNTGRSE